jgi:hypothetical protein
MRTPPAIPTVLRELLNEQDGAMTAAQALSAGLTRRQIRTLVEVGWSHPFQGVFVEPNVADSFRSSVRSALLACPTAVTHGVTAARLHRLWGLPLWTASEAPELILPRGQTFNTRNGLRLHKGLRDNEWCMIDGFPAADLERTVCQLSVTLKLDDLVCAIDSAIRRGWTPFEATAHPRRRLNRAIALSDARSESPLETYGRLLLVRAGLTPETLQYELADDLGVSSFRFDMAWPSAKLAVELDGREHHDEPDALYRDRAKANAAMLDGWRVLRFTWFDITQRPGWVIATVRRALIGG